MPTYYATSTPEISIDPNSGSSTVTVCHNHYNSIDFKSFKDGERLNQAIRQQKIAITGCMAFFESIANNEKNDPIVRATAKCALAEDAGRLRYFKEHQRATCTML